MAEHWKPNPEETQHYPLLEQRDREILRKLHENEQIRNLCEAERLLLRLIRTQLEVEWRAPLIDVLDRLMMMAARDVPPEDRISGLCAYAERYFWRPSQTP